MKTITVKVEQKHILDGLRCDSGNCPFALALAEIFPDHNIRVFGGHSYVAARPVEKWMAFKNSPAAHQFIVNVDMRRSVKPGTFKLRQIA